MSEVASNPVSQVLPGPLVAQATAITARLQLAFPPSLFRFKYLPARIDKSAWNDLTTGNQPFLGLGFRGFVPRQNARVLNGVAAWSLLCAVRRGGSPKDRYIGDTLGTGVLSMVPIAAAVLQGFVAATGSVEVTKITNVAADEWGGDSAIMELSLEVPVTFSLDEAIGNPATGIFKELAATWNVPTPAGGVDIYESDWENPNVPA
jgi:hypothetical protein